MELDGMERKIGLEVLGVLEELLNHGTDAVIMVGADFRILHSKGGVESTFGWRPEELDGMHLDVLLPESVREWHSGKMQSFAAHAPQARRMGERSSVFGRHRAGHLVPLDISLIVRNFDGAPVYVAVARDISGLREKEEEALRRSEERLRHAQRIARMGSWDVDLKAGELYWSDEVYEIFGIDKQGFKASFEAFMEFVHPEDRDMVAAASEASQAGDGHYATDHRIIRTDGEVRYVHEEAVIVRDGDGLPIAMQGIIHDITKRKQDENALRQMRNEAVDLRRQSESRTRELEAFLEAAAEGMIGTDADGNITIWNRAAEEFHGIDAEEARGMHIDELPTGDSRALRNERLRRLKRGEKFRHLAGVRIHRDGTQRQVEVSINPIVDQDGKFVGTAGFLRDMSDIKRERERGLESERRLADAITAITEAVAIFDADERLVHFNDRYARMVGAVEKLRRGMSWDYIVRSNLDAGNLFLPEVAADADDWLEMRRRDRRKDARSFLLPLPDDVWLLGRDYAMADGGFIMILQDVSELKRREAELARSNSELEQCALTVSHDLREPLSEIRSLSGVLQADYADALPEDAKSLLSRMTGAADRIETLIDGMLDLSKAQSGNGRLSDPQRNPEWEAGGSTEAADQARPGHRQGDGGGA